jgi:hypothetical protein
MAGVDIKRLLRIATVRCAASYFRGWGGIPMKWRGTSRRPIPDNWNSIGQRSSPYHLAGNRNASHPVNAILNHAYAVLESEIRIKAISRATTQQLGLCMRAATDHRNSFSIYGAGATEGRPRGTGFRQGDRIGSRGFHYPWRRRGPAKSAIGKDNGELG